MSIESGRRAHPRHDQHEQEPEGPGPELPVAFWDFSKIPVHPAGRLTGPRPAFPLIAASQPGAAQPKLAVGQVDSPLEREADDAADQVMRVPDTDASVTGESLNLAQKGLINGLTGPYALHAEHPGSPEATASEAPGTVQEVLRAPGQPLDAATRAFMETRFGYDFSSVRVHTDAAAAESAQSLSAVAYTLGQDVVFGAGQYAPGHEAGRKLLAHELAHTIHQRAVHRGASQGVAGRSEYDRGPDAAGSTLPRTPIKRLTSQGSSLILRQAAQADEIPAIDRDDPILLQKRLQSNPRSPEQQELDQATQRRLDEFRDGMKASYTADGATATVAPPFTIANSDSLVQQSTDQKFHEHEKNITKKDRRFAQLAFRVRLARGSSEEIRLVTQALIDDNALHDPEFSGSLEQRIQSMMFDYRVGTDCAGYVQQAYLSARGIRRSTAGFKNILSEDLGNLERQGFMKFDPSEAVPGDLVVWDSPTRDRHGNPEVGHRAIVYSRHEASADEKAALRRKLVAALQADHPGAARLVEDAYPDVVATGATIYVLELDSSWGNYGIASSGGIQRRTFWYNPAGTPKWAWTEDNPNLAYAGEIPYDSPRHPHTLRGFYRGPSRAPRGPSPARPITPAAPHTP